MAFFAPIAAGLATIGGGSAAAGALLVGTAVTGALSAKAQYDAGKISAAQYKLQAKQEGDAARAREIERKRALLTSLASQHARSGAQGVAMQGSNVAMANRDIKDNRQDLLYDTANTRTAQRILRSRASNASYQGGVGAITSIADTAMNIYQARG